MFGKVLIVSFALAFAACGKGQTKSDGNGNVESGNQNGNKSNGNSGNNNANDGNSSETVSISTPNDARAVSTIYYSPNRKLFVGYKDGTLAEFDIEGKTGKIAQLTKGVIPIAAVSNDGVFAVVDGNPPAVVKNNGQVVLQMNIVKSFESARFGGDGTTLYVADPNGKIRIWGQAHSFEEKGDTEKMEEYLNRQAPDFHVEFKSVKGPFTFSDENIMFVGDATGVISMWNPLKPSTIKKIMKLNGTVKSIDATGANVVATSTTGQLKVGILDPPSYLPWSKDAKGDYAAVDNYLMDNFVSLTGGTVALRTFESGDNVWSADLGGTRACGLDMSNDKVFACVDNAVVVLDASNGSVLSWFYVTDALHWQTGSGEKIQ